MVHKILVSLFLILTGLTRADQHIYLSIKNEKVIEQYSLNSESGELRLVSQLKIDGGPGSLTLSPDKKHLYFSISFEDKCELATAHIGKNGRLTFIGKAAMKHGGSGAISQDGKFYAKYNYAKCAVSILEMKKNLYTGKEIQKISTTKHPHDIGFSNDGSMLFIPHNRHNRLYQFRINPQGGLLPLSPAYLEGPNFDKKGFAAFRSMAFHPVENVVYCTYEKGGGVASLKYDSNGLSLWQEFSTTEKGQKVLPTVVAITPNKEFLYVPNRHGKKGGSSIAAFRLNPKTGEIIHRVGIYNYSAVGPRGMVIDNTGKFLFTSSVKTDSTYQFQINDNGSLKLIKELKIGSGSMLTLKK